MRGLTALYTFYRSLITHADAMALTGVYDLRYSNTFSIYDYGFRFSSTPSTMRKNNGYWQYPIGI